MAAKGRRISGIYIPIKLDASQIEQDIKKINTQLGTLSVSMSNAFKGSIDTTGLIRNFAQLTRSIGNVRDAANALNNLRPSGSFDQALRSNEATRSLKDLAQTLGITEQAQRKLLQTMAQNTAINQQVNGLRQLERIMGTTRKETLELAQSLGLVVDKATKLQYLGSQGRGILGAFSPSNMTAGIQSAMGALGVVGGMYGVVELGKSMAKAALQMDNITIAFESIYGSSSKAATQLKFVRQVADNLGLSFVDAADGAKKLFAAIENTDYASTANQVFQAFSNAGAALKLSGNDMNRVFLAVSQVYSKGKVAAEELRSQIAEVLPGAVTLFAKSIGVTTRELDKMLQDGAVGLEHMGKFAEALGAKYSAAAAAASTGLQAELNRVSNAWFDLRRAFVDTDETANLVRSLGNALKFLGDNADSIATVVKEIAKFAAVSAGVYIAISAINKLRLSIVALLGTIKKSTSVASFFAALGPAGAGIGALSLGIGALVTVLLSLGDGLSESDRKLKKLGEQTFDLEQAIKALGGASEEAKESLDKLQNIEIEKKFNQAKKDLDSLFEHRDDFDVGGLSFFGDLMAGLPQRTKNQLDKAFDELGKEVKSLTGSGQLASDFEQAARDLATKFKEGIENNLPAETTRAIALELVQLQSNFALTLSQMENSGGAEKALEKVNNMLGNIIIKMQGIRSEQDELAKNSDALQEAAAQSVAAYDSIAKITKGTAAAKESGLNQNLATISEKLITLSRNANAAQSQIDELGSMADKSSEDFLNLKEQTEKFEDALPRIADYAIKSGVSFEKLADKLWDAGIEAGATTEQLYKLLDALNAAVNVRIGDNIEKRIQALGEAAKTATASAKQKTLIKTFTKDIQDLEKKNTVITQIMSNDWKGLKDSVKEYGVEAKLVDQALADIDKSESARQAKRSSRSGRSKSRTKSAREQMTEFAKATGELEKKVASLQAKYDDDASIKYWADVRGELEKIDNILAKGAGTKAEKERLSELRQEYEALAQARAKQMEEEERRQKAMEAASKFGKGYGNLMDVSGAVDSGMQVRALQSQYEEMTISWKEALDKNTVTYEEYTAGIAALNEELQIKTDMANGSLVANFTDKINSSYEQIMDWQSSVSDIMMNGVMSMSNAFANFFVTNINDTKSLGEAFSDMVSGMIKSLAQLFMQMLIIATLKKVLGGIFGSAPTSGYSGTASNESAVGPVIPNGVYAKGGIFSGGGSISRHTNSIVTRPTFFSYGAIKPFARGGGIMGEKGWEAVMPLRKTRSGNLGVLAEGAGSNVEMNQAISINIINNTDSEVSAQKSTDSNGNVNIKVMIEKMVGEAMRRPGSAPARALTDVYGAQTVLADR